LSAAEEQNAHYGFVSDEINQFASTKKTHYYALYISIDAILCIFAMPDTLETSNQSASSPSTSALLATLGERIRSWRARRGMTRKMLAQSSLVSERHLAQVEAGKGNISVLLLQQIAAALSLPITYFFRDDVDLNDERQIIDQILARLPTSALAEIRRQLVRDHGKFEQGQRSRIALIGLRGAGKSALGACLAKELGCPFIELDREVERIAGMGLSELFSLYGQAGYRRFERRALETALKDHDRVVIATGGSIVSESATFELLLASCFTVWLKAEPEDHMSRVLAQGDLRPMAGNKAAMEDLKQILRGRAPLYGKADHSIDTSHQPFDQTLTQLLRCVKQDKEPK
jgi:XRE family transcriptional regulator, aerobic/anaerobic benzoate catabolism transcriptional regulator